MKKYLTRVVLHNCNGDDINLLHGEMQDAGFSATPSEITREHNILEAEYLKTGNEVVSSRSVCEQAKAVATRVVANHRGKSFSVLVTGPSDLAWYNLGRAYETCKT